MKTQAALLMTVVKEINEPRLPSLKGKMAAKKAAITVWTAEDLELEPVRIGLNGSPTKVVKIFTPPKPAGGKVFHGEPHQAVAQLLEELTKAGIPLGKARAEASHG